MFTSLATAREALEGVAGDFDASALTGDDARRAVDELGLIRRLTDGMLAKSAKRVSDRTAKSGPNAAASVARALGVTSGEVRGAIGTAAKLEQLPATDAAVRAGRLSLGQAKMIADAASKNPDAEPELLAAAELGLVPLRDACIAARARVEDPDERAETAPPLTRIADVERPDGMVAGRFRLTPETGGQVKAVRRRGAAHLPGPQRRRT